MLMVFPAHAGMSPMVVAYWKCEMSFPRPRGDEPQITEKQYVQARFSPPTRG